MGHHGKPEAVLVFKFIRTDETGITFPTVRHLAYPHEAGFCADKTVEPVADKGLARPCVIRAAMGIRPVVAGLVRYAEAQGHACIETRIFGLHSRCKDGNGRHGQGNTGTIENA